MAWMHVVILIGLGQIELTLSSVIQTARMEFLKTPDHRLPNSFH